MEMSLKVLFIAALIDLQLSTASGYSGCPRGYYPNGTTYNDCKGCPTGTYSPYGSSCLPCPEGLTTISWETVSKKQCTKCPRGYIEVDGECEACPQGTYWYDLDYTMDIVNHRGRLVPDPVCEPCENEMTTRGTGSESHYACVCPPGYKYQYSRRCKKCEENTYSDEYHGKCKPCPPHRVIVSELATNISDCVCEGGTMQHPEQPYCISCARGTYSAANSTSCTSCPEHMTTRYTGSDSEQDCVCKAGYFKADEGCVPCPPGSYSSSVGSTICTACPEGTTVNQHRTTCELPE